ncbi:MAG: hypothetical protein JNL67_04200 [Planctomycetaceae bacterium]|nr:hypothetical protein [Planctomycetaceae bacterium]
MSKFSIKGLVVAIAAVVMGSFAVDSAQAQSCGYGGFGTYGGGSGFSVQIGNVGFSSFNQVPLYNTRVYRSVYSTGPVWHDTSHWHYHGPSAVRHRSHYHGVPGHYHVVPGHYHMHRSGHWHW